MILWFRDGRERERERVALGRGASEQRGGRLDYVDTNKQTEQ